MRRRQNRHNPKKHRFIYAVLRGVAFLYTRLFLGYRCKDKYKIKKGESVVVLSNHQTDADPFCILTSFNRPVYPIATDNIFAGRFRGRFFSLLGVIPKKKGVSDFRTVAEIKSVIDNKGSILLFPEGNRSYCEFQFNIPLNTASLLKKFKATIILFNLKGGTGKSPRFKNKNRRGKFTGNIKRVLKYEEYSVMTDNQLLDVIKDGLRVYDSESGNLYKSKRRAEFLERIFFVCPVCGKTETLYSKGKYLYCGNCGAKAEFTEDLHLKSADNAFPFTKLLDYWNFQKRYLQDYEIKKGKKIFHDKRVKIMDAEPFKRRRVLFRGDISLDDEFLYYGKEKIAVNKIEIASVVSGRNLILSYEGKSYTIRGDKRFNPLKYAFIFNKLDTIIKEKGADLYYNLTEN